MTDDDTMKKPKPPTGDDLRKEAKKWLGRIKAAAEREKVWRDDAEEAVRAYTGEGNKVDASAAERGIAYDFNILFANVETIVPAIINSPPAPDIRRRFGQTDPVAKDYAEILERMIRVQIDDGKMQTELEAMAQDGFLAGRGITRLRFKSEFEQYETSNDELVDLAEGEKDDEDDEDEAPPAERPTNEAICFEAVSWRDTRHGPAKRWADVPWWAFRHSIPNDDLEEFADAEYMRAQADPEADARQPGEDAEDLIVWEVWDKKSRMVIFLTEAAEDKGVKLLKRVEDPLGLSKFFPINDPVQAIEVTGRLMPVNPFSIYKKLAEELDVTTKRIRIITKQLKVKGWYSGSHADLQSVLSGDDNEFVPVQDAEVWASKGGVQNAIAFWPVERLVLVLAELYKLRDQTKQAIYEITGISDIVRGASKATETLGAQQIKSQWGSLRIQKMQRMMERAARDLFVMMAEIIPSKFSPETIEKITGIQLVPTQEDLTPIQPQVPQIPPDAPPEAMAQIQQQAIAQAQEAEAKRMEKLQHLTQLQALMRERASTFYRIDVESDSTVRADLTRQKQEAAEFMKAASGYFAAVGPLVQQGALPMDVAVEIFASFSRLFNLGKSVEDALDELLDKAKKASSQPKPPNPAEVAAKAEAEANAAKIKAQAEKDALDIESKKLGLEKDRQIGAIDIQSAQLDHATKQANYVTAQTKTRSAQIEELARNGAFVPPAQSPFMGG